MKKIILIAIALSPALILLLDILNISNVIPLTNKYDWLAFFGSYISGICTIVLGLVTIKQNNSLSSLNKQMLSNDMVAHNFSQVEIEKENYYDANFKSNFDEAYGIKMYLDGEENNKDLFYVRLILQLNDKYNRQLMYGKIDKLEIYYNYKKAYVNEKRKVYLSHGEEVKLEVTPKEDRITYYLPICLIGSKETLSEINNSEKIRLVSTIIIKNSFNVVSRAEYTIHLTKGNKVDEEWTSYSLHGRKIYYKETTYEEE